jgi:hypothetical protein
MSESGMALTAEEKTSVAYGFTDRRSKDAKCVLPMLSFDALTLPVWHSTFACD